MTSDPRVQYWNTGATALRRLGYSQGYGCPLCFGLFGRKQLDQLTLDHVPPKSVGGKLKVLTCKACNSAAGAKLDAYAHQLDVFRRIGAGEPYPPVPARLTFEGITVNVEMRSDGALNDIRVLPGSNSPGVPHQFAATFGARAGHGSEINLILPTLKISERPAKISYLRAGYLAAFAAFGYSAIWWPSLDRVRQQIREPDVEHINPYFFYHSKVAQGYEVAATVEPKWYSSIVVLMGRYRIMLPLGDDAGLYERIAERAAGGVQAQVQCRRFGWPTWPQYANDHWLARSGAAQDR
jgi:HNH endonuclease